MDLGEPLQAETSVPLQSTMVDHTTDNPGLILAAPCLNNRFTSLEDRISRLEVVIQDLRNE
jgi:hypothetical protein